MPALPKGCCPVVPTGTVIDPVPGMIALSARPTVGFPLMPLPLVTAIWLAVPVMVAEVIAPPVESTTRPLKLAFAKLEIWPVNEMVGSPETPLPLEIDRPVPETAIERGVMAVEDVFTWNPVPEFTSDNKAPVVLILNNPWEPPSVMTSPLVTPT